jgi:hypothetical protein
MRVYKFLRAEFALQDLRKRQIKISTFPDINDPFELLGGLRSDHELSEPKRLVISRLNDWCGALCFSRDWHNPMLWSHYADKHKGICLGLEITASAEVNEPLYVAHREQFDTDMRTLLRVADSRVRGHTPSDKELGACEQATKRTLLTKFDAWRYEDEVRVFIELKPEQQQGGLFFAEFDQQIQPSTVILGPRCSEPRQMVEAAIGGYSPPITVIHTMLSPTSFEVVDQSCDFCGEIEWRHGN